MKSKTVKASPEVMLNEMSLEERHREAKKPLFLARYE